MRYGLLVFVLVFASSPFSRAQVVVPGESAQKFHELNERLVQEAQIKGAGSRERQDYRIGPEDLIDIAVFEVPELSHTVRVSAAGEVSLPLIGNMKVGGLSPIDLEQ